MQMKKLWSYDEAKQIGKDFFPEYDAVNHPKHYTTHPSGVECITITEHMNFCIGNAMKYLWRVDSKGEPIENLEKAHFYIVQEIDRRTRK